MPNWRPCWLLKTRPKPFLCWRSCTQRIPGRCAVTRCWPTWRRRPAMQPVPTNFIWSSGQETRDPDLLVAHGQNLIRQLKYAEAFAVFREHAHRPLRRRRLERAGFFRLENRSTRCRITRAYDAVKVPARGPLNILSLGNILRYDARQRSEPSCTTITSWNRPPASSQIRSGRQNKDCFFWKRRNDYHCST